MPKESNLLIQLQEMDSDADSRLKNTLERTVTNAVSRMEALDDAADRRCLFHEYKEWLGENLSDEVWAIPADWNHEWLDA